MNAKANGTQNYTIGNNALHSGGHLSTHNIMMRYIFDRILNNSVKYEHQTTAITEQM
jgi:hypothetical protein